MKNNGSRLLAFALVICIVLGLAPLTTGQAANTNGPATITMGGAVAADDASTPEVNEANKNVNWTITVTAQEGETLAGYMVTDSVGNVGGLNLDTLKVGDVSWQANPDADKVRMTYNDWNLKIEFLDGYVGTTATISFVTMVPAGIYFDGGGIANSATLILPDETKLSASKSVVVTPVWIAKKHYADGSELPGAIYDGTERKIMWEITGNQYYCTLYNANITDTISKGLRVILAESTIQLGSATAIALNDWSALTNAGIKLLWGGTEITADNAATLAYATAATDFVISFPDSSNPLTSRFKLMLKTGVKTPSYIVNSEKYRNTVTLKWKDQEGGDYGTVGVTTSDVDVGFTGLTKAGKLLKNADGQVNGTAQWTVTVNPRGQTGLSTAAAYDLIVPGKDAAGIPAYDASWATDNGITLTETMWDALVARAGKKQSYNQQFQQVIAKSSESVNVEAIKLDDAGTTLLVAKWTGGSVPESYYFTYKVQIADPSLLLPGDDNGSGHKICSSTFLYLGEESVITADAEIALAKYMFHKDVMSAADAEDFEANPSAANANRTAAAPRLPTAI